MSKLFGTQQLTVIAQIKGPNVGWFRVFMGEFDKITTTGVPTVIEIDPSCRSAYVRFRKTKVHRTVSDSKRGPVMAIDLDARGQVVGIELVGVANFSVKAIRRQLPERFKKLDLDQAEFMPTPACRVEPIAA
jgi:uncharacterized protein YuzE